MPQDTYPQGPGRRTVSFEPDLIVMEPEAPSPSLVVEVKLSAPRREHREALALYMLSVRCPLGLLITPARLLILRDRFTGAGCQGAGKRIVLRAGKRIRQRPESDDGCLVEVAVPRSTRKGAFVRRSERGSGHGRASENASRGRQADHSVPWPKDVEHRRAMDENGRRSGPPWVTGHPPQVPDRGSTAGYASVRRSVRPRGEVRYDSPSISMVCAPSSRRSSAAAARSGSPKSGANSSTERFEVMIVERR